MPYIPPEDRTPLDPRIDELAVMIDGPGELNYVITRLCMIASGPNPNYAKFNQIVGVLECAKLEFYARRIRPYEDSKIATNGDL